MLLTAFSVNLNFSSSLNSMTYLFYKADLISSKSYSSKLSGADPP